MEFFDQLRALFLCYVIIPLVEHGNLMIKYETYTDKRSIILVTLHHALVEAELEITGDHIRIIFYSVQLPGDVPYYNLIRDIFKYLRKLFAASDTKYSR